MTATAHALVAGAIASHIPNPALAVLLSFASHFIMDAVPHWDMGTNWRKRTKRTTGLLALADTLVGITVTYFFFSGKVALLPLVSCILAAELPDWLETPWYIWFAHQDTHEPGPRAGFLEILTYRIYKIENAFHAKAQFPFGVYTQVATVLFFLLLLS